MTAKALTSVKLEKPRQNTFDLTHDVKMSGKMGWLMPSMLMDCVPGDKINIACDSFTRFAPMIAPIMHRVNIYTHYFFVPWRIVWPNFEAWIEDADSGIDFPTLTWNSALPATAQRLGDYMGVPPYPTTGGPYPDRVISAIPFAAYQMIYNEYYRDQNLIAPVDFELVDGSNDANVTALTSIRNRAWSHDYFTSMLPFAQKGNPVDIPLGTVELDSNWSPTAFGPTFVNTALGPASGDIEVNLAPIGINVAAVPGSRLAYDPQGSLIVGATTINDLRRAFRLQEWLELQARGGTRYTEQMRAHFAVFSSDKRLQRPEYITGTKSDLVISEVLNTSGATGADAPPQGNMAGHGVSVGSGYEGDYFCEEHGYIIGITSIIPLPAYQDGIPKHFRRFDMLDLFWPKFAHLGEQPVTETELYAYGGTPDRVLGYLPRYMEYRLLQNRVAGDFRESLYFWHLGRIFSSAPSLNQQFIEVSSDFPNRIFAVQDGTDYIYMYFLHKIKAHRRIPVYGTPML